MTPGHRIRVVPSESMYHSSESCLSPVAKCLSAKTPSQSLDVRIHITLTQTRTLSLISCLCLSVEFSSGVPSGLNNDCRHFERSVMAGGWMNDGISVK